MVFSSVSNLSFAQEESTYVDDQLDFMKKLINYIKANYVEEINDEEIIKGAYNGLFEALDDYSIYFPQEEDYDNFVESVSGEYSGIGITVTTKDNQCMVISTMYDSPAYKAGILPEDVIVEVNGEDVSASPSEYVVNLLRGEAGTKVVVGVQRKGFPGIKRFNLNRQIIKIQSVSYEIKENNIGYIRIISFDSNTGDEFKEALSKLKAQNAKALIIDLRNNGGGYINTALEVAEQIVPEGPVFHFETKGEITDTFYSETPQIDMPVAVLINKGSASASELLAGAIQDTKSGTIIGTTSFGKGSAQQSLNLKNGSGMKLTVAHFLTPNENIIHGKGITPDIIIQNKISEEYEALLKEVEGFAPMIETVKPGLNDKGLNVFGAQQRLKFLGYEGIELSGIMDESTFKAIKHFQKSKGLSSYGTLDYTTRDYLKSEVITFIEKQSTDAQLEKAMEILK